MTCNLLSIGKITKDHNCVTQYFPTHCKFQDLDSVNMIGNPENYVGLYLFKVDNFLEKQTQCVTTPTIVGQSIKNSCSVSFLKSNNDNVIMLWHFRLGHPSFKYLSKLFPSLFRNKNPSLSQCEICQLSKHLPC